MTTPQPIAPPPQDPDVLKALVLSIDAQLVALDANNAASAAMNAHQYALKKSNLNQQKAKAEAQLAAMTTPAE